MASGKTLSEALIKAIRFAEKHFEEGKVVPQQSAIPSRTQPIEKIVKQPVAPTSDVIPTSSTLPNPSGSDIQQTNSLAKLLGLEVKPKLKAVPDTGSGTLPRPTTEKVNPITGEIEHLGSGVPSNTSTGAINNPLDESVRAQSVIEGTTRPVKVKGQIQRDPFTQEIQTEIVNPGIEPRVKQLRAEGETPASEIEARASSEHDAQAAANQAKYAPKTKKVIGGKKIDQYGKPIKSQGNPENKGKSPSEVFGEIQSEKVAGKVKGDENLGQEVIGEIDSSRAQRNRIDAKKARASDTNPKFHVGKDGTRTRLSGEGAQKYRDAEQLESLGRTADDQRAIDEISKIGDMDEVGIIKKKFDDREITNSTIQDLYSRLDKMFPGFDSKTPDSDAFFEFTQPKFPMDAKKIERGLNQGSAASKLVDTRKQLAELSDIARDPASSPVKLRKAQKELAEIDAEYFGTNRKFNELNADQSIDNLQTAKSFDDSTEELGEAIGLSRETSPDVGELQSVGPRVTKNRKDSLVQLQKLIKEFGEASPEVQQFKVAMKRQQDMTFGHELGPKSSPLVEQLKRNQSGFDPSQTRSAAPTEGTLSPKDTLINILRDIQQGKLGPIGQ